jgi:hypothetical protein
MLPWLQASAVVRTKRRRGVAFESLDRSCVGSYGDRRKPKSTGVIVVHDSANPCACGGRRMRPIRVRSHRLECRSMACHRAAACGCSCKPHRPAFKPRRWRWPARLELVSYGSGWRPPDALDRAIAAFDGCCIHMQAATDFRRRIVFNFHVSPCRLPYPPSDLKPPAHCYPLRNGITVN